MPAESQACEVPKAPVVGEPSGSTSQSEGSVQVPSVDEIVQDRVFYVKLCEEQSEFFRQNNAEFKEAVAAYSQSSDVAKPGQNWKPSDSDRNAFVAEMKRRCSEVPTSIAE